MKLRPGVPVVLQHNVCSDCGLNRQWCHDLVAHKPGNPFYVVHRAEPSPEKSGPFMIVYAACRDCSYKWSWWFSEMEDVDDKAGCGCYTRVVAVGGAMSWFIEAALNIGLGD